MYKTCKPLVSIIIPTYNREHILACAIESALAQTYPHTEIIVVDDGSADKTCELVARYAGVTYIFQENGGQGKARNTGLSHAKGSYIASLDADDTWGPEFLERCIDKLEAEHLGFVFANWNQVVNSEVSYNYFTSTNILKGLIPASDKKWVLLENDMLRKIYLDRCPSPSSSFVCKREAMIGKWNEDMRIADDWCLLLDMILKRGCKAAFTTEVLWTKRTDGQNICDGRNLLEVIEFLYIKDYSAILERHRNLLKESEIEALNKKISRYIYELFLHKLFSLKQTARNSFMLKEAFSTEPMLFGKVFLKFTYRYVRLASRKVVRNWV